MGEEQSVKRRRKRKRKRKSKALANNTLDFLSTAEAARRRRKAGRRRMCEGMCFSLPTIDDPFNEQSYSRRGKRNVSRMQEEGKRPSIDDTGVKNMQSKGSNGGKQSVRLENRNGVRQEKCAKLMKKINAARNFYTEHTSRVEDTATTDDRYLVLPQTMENDELQGRSEKDSTDLSQRENPDDTFNYTHVKNDLNLIQSDKHRQGHTENVGRVKWVPSITVENDLANMNGSISADNAFRSSIHALLDARLSDSLVGKRLARGKLDSNEISKKVARKWDWQFWEACGTGLDILATCGTSRLIRAPAYVVAAAAHIIGRRLQNGSCQNPLVVILLASQAQTLQVRQICRPLKAALNIQSVSLHPGTPLQHQIEGLSTKLPEILVATPEQLCKLLALRALYISDVSFMVVDDLAEAVTSGFSNELEKIRLLVHPSVQTAIISSSFSDSVAMLCRDLVRDPISRVTSDRSVAERSAGITQSVSFIMSEETKIQKFLRILKQSLTQQQEIGILVILQQSDVEKLISVLHAKEYSVGCFTECQIDPSSVTIMEHFMKRKLQVLLCKDECVNQLDLSQVRTVIFYDFPSTMEAYSNVLTRMASFTINGTLHSFCSASMAPLASEFVQLLIHCSQPVPQSLKMLAEAAALVQQN